MRRRVDIEPNHAELIELLRENPLGRNLDLVTFMNELMETKALYTYFIDGEWGSGKTIFVKQLVVLMELINELCSEESEDGSQLKNSLEDAPDLNSLIAEISEKPGEEPRNKSLYPVYYNA